MVKGMDLNGRVVIVTGGARGIGRAVAAEALRRGARVGLGDIDLAAAQATARELSAGGCEVPFWSLDVTDTVSFKLFLAAAEQALGPVDVLVHCAGVMAVGPFDQESECVTERMLDINLHGTIRAVKLVAPLMRSRGQGHLILLASAASKVPASGQATYAATKHGVYGYLSAVRAELHGTGVNVSLVMPGLIRTELAKGIDAGATKWIEPEELAVQIVNLIERPRFELAYPAWLVSGANAANLLPDRLRYALQRLLVPNFAARPHLASQRAEYEKRTFGK